MKRLLVLAIFASIGVASCSGGGASGPSLPITGSGAGTGASSVPASAIGVKATVTFTVPKPGNTSPNAKARKPMVVSPETANIYIALQSSPGNGNSAFAYTLAVNSTNCSTGGSPPNSQCSLTILLPVGNDLISILTANASAVPLDYFGSVPFTVTAAGPNSLNAFLSPIFASAIPSYGFFQINGGNVSLPLVSAAGYDASGDPLATSGTFPDGGPYNSIGVSQTAGIFETIGLLNSGQGGYGVNGPYAAGTTTTFPLAEHGGFVLELGNGTTSVFTTTLSLTTALVNFTQIEFPQLTAVGLTVPASSNSITLTCAFPSNPTSIVNGLTSDPCPGTASASSGVMLRDNTVQK